MYVGEHASKPLLVPNAKARGLTGRLSTYPIRGGDNEPLLSTSARACLENGLLSCRAGRATVKVEETCSYDPAQARGYIYDPAIKATQVFAVVGCFSFSRHDAACISPIKGSRKEALSRRPWRPHLVR